jgi:hypothetical protein
MFHVKVSNIHGRQFSAKFENKVDAENWLQGHINKENFGKNAREVRQENKPVNLEYKEVEKYKFDPSTYEIVLDDLGLPVVEGIEYLVTYPPEYSYTIEETETSLEPEEYLRLLTDKRDLILEKTDFTQIADCPLEPEIKKLFREYREYLRNFSKGETLKSITKLKLQNFEQFYRKKYIEVSNSIISKTKKINDKINKILE